MRQTLVPLDSKVIRLLKTTRTLEIKAEATAWMCENQLSYETDMNLSFTSLPH